ncbi:hypothetical protein CEXT_318751 [Caerostris extrusa]|uniref:Transposase n=1 Tax=Caerostris extrusa TaxID=172846 RepID=A0AAV4QFT6_CAEEX|nr:hypothetical protein CEXT_318751 [Caerostris extrusa]
MQGNCGSTKISRKAFYKTRQLLQREASKEVRNLLGRRPMMKKACGDGVFYLLLIDGSHVPIMCTVTNPPKRDNNAFEELLETALSPFVCGIKRQPANP